MKKERNSMMQFPFRMPVEMHENLRTLAYIENTDIAVLIRKGIEIILKENEKIIKKYKK